MTDYNLTTTKAQSRPDNISAWIIRIALPIGWLALLTGLFWIGDRSLYHKLYYAFLGAPALVTILMEPRRTARLLRHPLLICYLAFALYICVTIFWTNSETAALSLIKRPFYVLILLLSAALLALAPSLPLSKVLAISASIAAISAIFSLIYFLYSGHRFGVARLEGYGALYNPLLTAHVYGFFAAFWLASWFNAHRAYSPSALICLAILGVLIIATGSRTPLLALSCTATWLCLSNVNRRSIIVLITGAAFVTALLYFSPASIFSRGFSYRPDIWLEALHMAQSKLLFGYGYDHQLMLELEGTGLAFNDPHNIEIAVLLAGGLFGLGLWAMLYGIALIYSWRNKANPAIRIASSLLVFGLVAGLTEGRDFLSRPKEHWFLIWIPFAVLLHAWIAKDIQSSTSAAKSSKPSH